MSEQPRPDFVALGEQVIAEDAALLARLDDEPRLTEEHQRSLDARRDLLHCFLDCYGEDGIGTENHLMLLALNRLAWLEADRERLERERDIFQLANDLQEPVFEKLREEIAEATTALATATEALTTIKQAVHDADFALQELAFDKEIDDFGSGYQDVARPLELIDTVTRAALATARGVKEE